MKNFNQYFTEQFTRSGVFMAAVLLLFFNIGLGWFTTSQYQDELRRQEDSLVTMLSHLSTYETPSVMIVYLEHYSHTNGIRLSLVDPSGDTLFESAIAPVADAIREIETLNHEPIGTLTLDYQVSLVTQSFLTSLLVLNGSSLVLLGFVWWVLTRLGRRQYDQLTHDFQQIGHPQPHFQFADVAIVHDRYQQLVHLHHALRQQQTTDIRNLAHDLKTPLTVLKTTLEAVASGRLQWTPDLLQSLQEEVIILQTQLPQLVEQTQLYVPHQQDLVPLIEAAIVPLRSLLTQKDITLQLSLEPLEAIVDRKRFQQVIEHVVMNAYYYSNPHTTLTITLSADVRELTIQDQGIGMNEATLTAIQKGPYRDSQARQRYLQGNGLGLQIVKEFVTTNQWSWQIISAPHQGTTIIFQIA
jgi:signal transduction histidine kinase